MKPIVKPFLALSIVVLLALSANARADSFEQIKQRVIEQGIGSGVSDKRIANLLSYMNKDGSFPRINYENLSREGGFPHRRHLVNLFNLGLHDRIVELYHG